MKRWWCKVGFHRWGDRYGSFPLFYYDCQDCGKTIVEPVSQAG